MYYVVVDGKEGWIPSDILRLTAASRRSSVCSSVSSRRSRSPSPSHRSRSISPSPMNSRSPSPMDMSEIDGEYTNTRYMIVHWVNFIYIGSCDVHVHVWLFTAKRLVAYQSCIIYMTLYLSISTYFHYTHVCGFHTWARRFFFSIQHICYIFQCASSHYSTLHNQATNSLQILFTIKLQILSKFSSQSSCKFFANS